MSIFEDIHNAVIDGDNTRAKSLVQAALAEAVDPNELLNAGLISGMAEVGRRFECGEYYVPEMLVSARAMKESLAILRPSLQAADVKPAGRIVLATVRGDLHDIGKNLVGIMMEGAGFEVIDLGVDVAPEQVVTAVQEKKPHLVGLSALLTTTMPSMQTTIKALQEAGLRDQVKVMVGGAPVTEAYAASIGADLSSPDAAAAASAALTAVAQ